MDEEDIEKILQQKVDLKDGDEDDVIKLKFLMSGILVIQFVYFVKIIITRYYILLPQSDPVLLLVTKLESAY